MHTRCLINSFFVSPSLGCIPFSFFCADRTWLPTHSFVHIFVHSFLQACIQRSFLNNQTLLSALGILKCINQANISIFLELTFYQGRQTSDNRVIHAETNRDLGTGARKAPCLTQSGALGKAVSSDQKDEKNLER